MITVEQIHEIIHKIVPEVDVSKIDPQTSFKEYGIDSMDFFNIILELQELLGKEIPNEEIDQVNTVSSMLEYCKKQGF